MAIASPYQGVPLTDARRRRTVAPALGAATTGANQPALPGMPAPPLEIGDATLPPPRGLPAAPVEIGDAMPRQTPPGSSALTQSTETTGPGGLLGQPGVVAGVPLPSGFSSAPASRSDGSPVGGMTPQPPTGLWKPRPPAGLPVIGGGAGGFSLGGAPSGYAQTSSYGPGNDLRSTQIAPGDSAATQGANAATTNALGAYQSWAANPWTSVAAGSYNPAADTTGLRSSLTQALSALQSAPDRGQLANQNFNLLDQTAREASNRDLRVIGQDAAKFGRIGSGITTTNLGDLGERQAIDRSRAQSQMSLDAAGQTMGDRLATANAIGSGFGALSGADRADAGVQQGLRNEARGERTDANAYNAADFTRKGQIFGDLAAYGQQQTNNDTNRRDELRGERAYQTGQEATAYGRSQDAITGANAQTNAAVSRALQLLGAGSGTDLGTILQRAGAGQQAQGGQSGDAIAQLLAALSRGQGT